MKLKVALALGALWLIACEGPAAGSSPTVRNRQFVTATAVERGFGASCAEGGPSGCGHGLLCLKTGPGLDERVCSRECGANHDCPRGGWGCSKYYPGKSACRPPAGFVARELPAEAQR